jgi:hypothetical protein
VQALKQETEMASTEAGTQIDRSDEQDRKADSPTHEIREPASKVKFESFVQDWKQDFEIFSIDAGRQTSCSDEQL